MNEAYLNEATKALEKAESALNNATHDWRGGFYLATANRAYYSCFYCMVALLYTKGAYAKTHHGVKAKFSELFVKPALFPVDAAKGVTDLFDSRQKADYDLDAEIPADEAKELIDKASNFFGLTKQYIESLTQQ